MLQHFCVPTMENTLCIAIYPSLEYSGRKARQMLARW